MAGELETTFNEMLARCESPIERDVATGLAVRWLDRTRGRFRFWPAKGNEFRVMRAAEDNPDTLSLFPQEQIGHVRVDFVVRLDTDPDDRPLLFVECDGHDFHERTKEQAKRDRQRDRYLQSLGHPVLRFTGSEIWADHYEVADEIIDALLKLAER